MYSGSLRLRLLALVVFAFSVPALAINSQFFVPPSIHTDLNAYSIAIQDFDGDGQLDMAVANYNGGNAGTVTLLFGNGDGTFRTPVNITVGFGPRAIIAVDLNKDSKWDLVTVNDTGESISVLIGNGNGTFQAPVSYAVGHNPWSVNSGFVNADNNVDLLVANNKDNTVSILYGNGDGTFQLASPQPIGNGPLYVTLADVNNDGKPDLLTANFATGANSVSVEFGNGDGTFQAESTYTTDDASCNIAVVDFDGDGWLDLAVANELGHTV